MKESINKSLEIKKVKPTAMRQLVLDILSKAKDADYWIASGNADFSGADERYKMFKAYKKNNIYK